MGKDECKDLDKIKKLVDLMIDKGLAELEIVDGDDKIHLKRSLPPQPVITQIPVGQMPVGPVAVAGAGGGVADIAAAAGAAAGGFRVMIFRRYLRRSSGRTMPLRVLIRSPLWVSAVGSRPIRLCALSRR